MILCFWDEIFAAGAEQDFKWPALTRLISFFLPFKTSDKFEDMNKYSFYIFSTLSALIFITFNTAEQRKQMWQIDWEIKETIRIALTFPEFVLEEN